MSAPLPPFTAGQLWTYAHRLDEERSRVRILLVESLPVLGEVVHVRVEGLRMRNPHAKTGFSKVIGHMPFAADAVRQSVTELVGQLPLPDDWRDGYDTWRTAFDAGQAGVYSIPLAETIEVTEQALARPG